MRYGTILADPPWQIGKWGKCLCSRSTELRYLTQADDWIASLPVAAHADRNSALLLWVTNAYLPVGLCVLEAWGFEYRTMVTWVKMAAPGVPRIGLGYRARGCTEQLLIGIRGNVPAPPPDLRPNSVMFCPRGEHSAKPSFQYDFAELYPGPYLELFHRPREGGLFPPRPGWTFMGNEVDGQDLAAALEAGR